jgi:malonate-semialdehyde dehydrogenase (acetylating)/methylmalonate-semialdehyde dehydrogenase
VISPQAAERIAAAIESGSAEGAEILAGGGTHHEGGGSYVEPTIVGGIEPGSRLIEEEIFGPVLTQVHAESLDEALDIVNSSSFGNGVSIFTESGAAVRRFRHDVEVGMVGVNVGVAAPVAFFPFSGWKDSFLGDLHAHGRDAVEFFTRKKTVTSRWFSDGSASGPYFVED